MKKIILSGAYMDLLMPKEEFEGYKQENRKMDWVYKFVSEKLSSQDGLKTGGRVVRKIWLEGNDFFSKQIIELPFIGYSDRNKIGTCPDDKICIRLFGIRSILTPITPDHEKFGSINDAEMEIKFSNYLLID